MDTKGTWFIPLSWSMMIKMNGKKRGAGERGYNRGLNDGPQQSNVELKR